MRFKFRKGVFIFFCIMALLFLFFIIKAFSRKEFNAGSGLFILLLIFFSILSFKAYVMSLDMTIDDNGICRFFSGRKILCLKWSDIKMVRDIIGKNLSGPALRYFSVIPRDGVFLSFWCGDRIRFSDSMYDFPEFVHVMNKQIRSHSIRIERVRGVDIEVCDEIFVTERGGFKMP